MSTYELYHHGILGMKWGVRRYQNRDGTLTPKGKKRYGKDGEVGEQAKAKSSTKAKDSVKRLSDEELRSRVERLNTEKRLLELERDIARLTMPEVAQTPQVQKGRGIVKEALGKAAKQNLETLATKAGEYAVNSILKKAGIQIGDGELDALKRDAEVWKNRATVATSKKRYQEANDWFKAEYAKQKGTVEADKARTRSSVENYRRTVNQPYDALPTPANYDYRKKKKK